jgi:ATP-dependent helicase/nuclease subunit A
VLYVAMTRAVHALHMILPAKENSSIPKTLAGLLLVGLGGGQSATAGSTLFETGDSQWYEQCPELRRPVESSPRETSSVRIEFAELTGGRRRGLERIIPSQLADKGTSVKLASVLPLDDAAGVDRGTLFHAWLERIQWLEDGLLPDDQLRQIAEAKGAPHLDIDRCLLRFHAMLQQTQISSVLSRRSYQSLHGDVELDLSQERRLNVIDAGRTISGSIDRLVLIRRNGQVVAADIIDYKTDALIGDEETAVRDKVAAYRDQMQSYARAIALMYKLAPDRISTRLVMLAIGRVETVE